MELKELSISESAKQRAGFQRIQTSNRPHTSVVYFSSTINFEHSSVLKITEFMRNHGRNKASVTVAQLWRVAQCDDKLPGPGLDLWLRKKLPLHLREIQLDFFLNLSHR